MVQHPDGVPFQYYSAGDFSGSDLFSTFTLISLPTQLLSMGACRIKLLQRGRVPATWCFAKLSIGMGESVLF